MEAIIGITVFTVIAVCGIWACAKAIKREDEWIAEQVRRISELEAKIETLESK